MADNNQYQRSKEKLTRILDDLNLKKNVDPDAAEYIKMIERSIEMLNLKLLESAVGSAQPES